MRDTLKFSAKLFLCVLAVCIFSFVLVIFVGMDSPELTVVDSNNEIISYTDTSVELLGNLCAVATTAGLCILVYHYSWDCGFNDYNKKFSEAAVHYKFKGLVCGVLAVLPIVILGAASFAGVSVYVDYAYRVFMAPFIFWYNKMYAADNYLFCRYIILVVPIVSTFSYILGKNNTALFQKLLYGRKFKPTAPERIDSAMDIMNEKNRDNLK